MTAAPAAAQRIPKRFIVLTALLLIATLCAAAATQHWILELFSHFRPLYAVLSAICAIALLLLYAWRWVALALGLAFWNGYPVAQALMQTAAPAVPTATQAARQFTVLHFNVGRIHEQPDRIASYLKRNAKTIDIVVLMETTHDFAIALDELKELYPHQIRHLDNGAFGIVALSKHPYALDSLSLIPSERYPHIEATIRLPGRETPLALYAIHPPPPISGPLALERNRKLDYIARAAAAQAKATPVVVGDFNVTPWSPYFQRFAADSGLRDARTAREFEHTWPVTFEHAKIGIAIDHSFAHPSLPLIKRVIGPDLGSDHMPVTVTFGY